MTMNTMPPEAEVQPAAKSVWYSFPACALSFMLAIGLSGLVLAYPKVFAPDGIQSVNHGLLNLMMLGIAAGFVHGVGFVPRYWLWKWLFGPWAGWPLMIGGFWLILMT